MLALTVFAAFKTNKACAQDPYVGEIRMFAGNFAPYGWLMCNGQTLSIQQYTPLFALLGTTYGGNGTTTFQLPDFRGRVPMGQGQGNGLTNTVLGQQQGNETVTLIVNNIPAHNHTLNIYNGAGELDSLTSSATGAIALPLTADLSRAAGFSAFPPNMILNQSSIGATGSSVPFSVKQPSLTVTFIIATTGIWPSQQ